MALEEHMKKKKVHRNSLEVLVKESGFDMHWYYTVVEV